MSIDRKLRLVTMLGLFAARAGYGQLSTVPLPPTRFGLTAGMNFADLTGVNFKDGPYRRGFVGGVSLVTPFTQQMAFQLEALFSMKGGVALPAPASTATLKLDYIEFPLMVRVDIPASRTVRPFVVSGPAFNFRLRCGVDATSSFGSAASSCDELETDQQTGTFRSYDFGWILGGGIAVEVRGRALSLGARYELGFRGLTSRDNSKNRVLSIVASVEAPLPRRVVH